MSGSLGAGETDVWEVIRDVRRRYEIDPNKIVLTGYSMGGGGSMRLGLTDPGRLAALAPLACLYPQLDKEQLTTELVSVEA